MLWTWPKRRNGQFIWLLMCSLPLLRSVKACLQRNFDFLFRLLRPQNWCTFIPSATTRRLRLKEATKITLPSSQLTILGEKTGSKNGHLQEEYDTENVALPPWVIQTYLTTRKPLKVSFGTISVDAGNSLFSTKHFSRSYTRSCRVRLEHCGGSA